VNHYRVTLENSAGSRDIGTYTSLSSARRAGRREMNRQGGRAYIEGRGGWPMNDLFLTEAIEPLYADGVVPIAVPPGATVMHGLRQQEAPDCETCVVLRFAEFGPPHDPSPRCESGKHPHCSCDVCF
jgi:hypothetical protein